MPITQKRIYEVTISERLQRLLDLENHTVTTLKELRDAYFAEGNEISDILGSFVVPNQLSVSSVVSVEEAPKRGRPRKNTSSVVGHSVGTAEQKNQIFALLKEKGKLTSRQISDLTGIAFPTVCAIMHFLSESKKVTTTRNPDVKYREFLFALPPSDITVAALKID